MSGKRAKRLRREQREAGVLTKHERRRVVYDAEQAAIARRKAEFEALPEEKKEEIREENRRVGIMAGRQLRQLATMAGIISNFPLH